MDSQLIKMMMLFVKVKHGKLMQMLLIILILKIYKKNLRKVLDNNESFLMIDDDAPLKGKIINSYFTEKIFL